MIQGYRIIPSISLRTSGFARFLSATSVVSKKRVVFLGTPSVAALSLDLLHQASLQSAQQGSTPFEIVRVVTQPPSAVGRKHTLTRTPVHTLAEQLRIPVSTPATAKDEDFLADLEGLGVDLFVTAAYGNYLPRRFLSMARHGTLNIHPSLLPRYRGAAPVQRCLEQGDALTGVTVLYSVQKMDAGPILAQVQYPLSGHESASTVLNDCFAIGTKALIDALPKVFSGDVQPTEQNHELATAAAKIESVEGLVDFDKLSATQIYNKARAFAEWPGLFTYFKVSHEDKEEVLRIKLLSLEVLKDPLPQSTAHQEEVRVAKINGRDMLVVNCFDGSALGILELQPSAKKPMGAKAFANGHRGHLTRIPPPSEAFISKNKKALKS